MFDLLQKFSTKELERMLLSLENDDPNLIQGETINKSGQMCIIAVASGKKKTEAIIEYVLTKLDTIQDFVIWYDETPRTKMRETLIPVIQNILISRGVL